MAGGRCPNKFWEIALSDKEYPDGLYCREGLRRGDSQRDWTEVEDGIVHRGVWNCNIATYDKDNDILTIRSCGWHSQLTKERLNQAVERLKKIL